MIWGMVKPVNRLELRTPSVTDGATLTFEVGRIDAALGPLAVGVVCRPTGKTFVMLGLGGDTAALSPEEAEQLGVLLSQAGVLVARLKAEGRVKP